MLSALMQEAEELRGRGQAGPNLALANLMWLAELCLSLVHEAAD